MKATDSFVPRLMRAARDGHGIQPAHDLKSELETVWQEFTSPAAAEGETAQ
jgi:hypothetical protein